MPMSEVMVPACFVAVGSGLAVAVDCAGVTELVHVQLMNIIATNNSGKLVYSRNFCCAHVCRSVVSAEAPIHHSLLFLVVCCSATSEPASRLPRIP
jgi:hypothetical protein